MFWDFLLFRGWKDEEDLVKEVEMKWLVGEEENKRKWCFGSLVEEGFKIEGLINCV